MWFAGIDWADAHHDVVVVDEQGHRVGSIHVEHTPAGLERLSGFLHQIIGSAGQEQMACVLETSHGLLIAALLEAGWPLYPVNPRTVERRRGPAGAKTDRIDAYLLAKTGRADFADLRRLLPDSDLVRELKALTHGQDALIEGQTRLVNQLTACLKAYYPVALQWFTKLQQRSVLLFLRAYPTPQAVIAVSQDHLASTLKQAGHTNPVAAACKIFATLQQPHFTADAITTRTQSRLLLAVIAQLVPLLEQIAAYDQEIARLFASHPDHEVFASLPGAGKRLAPRLLAEWGDDRSRYLHATGLQALAGTSPVMFQSGAYAKAHRRLGCVKPLRRAFHLFAWNSTLQEPWAKAYYQRKRAEGKSHSVAVRGLANIWVRILFAIWQKRERYQTIIFEAAQQRHAKRVA